MIVKVPVERLASVALFAAGFFAAAAVFAAGFLATALGARLAVAARIP